MVRETERLMVNIVALYIYGRIVCCFVRVEFFLMI